MLGWLERRRFSVRILTRHRLLYYNTEEMKKPQVQPDTEWLCPDEMELLLEAIHAFKATNDGRRHSGRLAWIRSKLVRAKLEGVNVRCYNS
jgi:hypothetical protein